MIVLNNFTRKNERDVERQFLEAYDTYAENILRHARLRVSDQNIAQDITSETFLKVWNYVRKNNEIKNFKGFLYKTADNLIIDYYRTKKHQNISIEMVEEEYLADKTDLMADIERAFSFENIMEHLQSLPEDHRAILIYRYIDELDILTIRKLTGKSVANVYVTIHRALKSLKKRIIKQNEN
jgi:RNA polymerase sigma-70 factor (ECF subfamily)